MKQKFLCLGINRKERGIIMKIRNLKPNEIELKQVKATTTGITLLCYQNARVGMDILDESFGPLGWKKRYSNDNKNCIISVYNAETNEWIEREDVGSVVGDFEKDKALAYDAFKRACVNFGIGRNLYTCPKIYIEASFLKHFDVTRGYCRDSFKVESIEYDKKTNNVLKLVVGIYSPTNPIPHTKLEFLANGEKREIRDTVINEAGASGKEVVKMQKPDVFKDDEVMIICHENTKVDGKCPTFGEYKKTPYWQMQKDNARKNPADFADICYKDNDAKYNFYKKIKAIADYEALMGEIIS